MTASRERFAPEPKPKSRSKSRSNSQKVSPPKVSELPSRLGKSNPLPAWLKSLLIIQKGSIGLTILLSITVFGVYSWTVYAKKTWNEQYRKLEHLQRSERQFTATEEALGHDLVTNAQKTPSHLIREKPSQAVFLETPTARPKLPEPAADPAKDRPPNPLGY